MTWNFKSYGTASDPIHKSDLAGITGDYGCDRAFKYKKDALAEAAESSADGSDVEPYVTGKAAAGNAAHETIARALKNPEARKHLLAGGKTSPESVAKVFAEEMRREVGSRELRWYRDDDAKIYAERVAMIVGLLNDLHNHVAEIVLVEAGFIVRCEGYWLSGHIDLLYRPKSNPSALAIADWKTGSQKPSAIELDHGWEAGIYSQAVHSGHFDGGLQLDVGPDATSRDRREALDRRLIAVTLEHGDGTGPTPSFGQFPAQIFHVHLHDYVPYSKAGTKEVKRPEDAAFYAKPVGEKVKYAAGELRGPAWLPVRRSEQDIPRLAYQLRQVVGTVRMGRFPERVGEKCSRCAFQGPCLSTGYDLRGDDKRAARLLLNVLDVDSFDDGLGAG